MNISLLSRRHLAALCVLPFVGTSALAGTFTFGTFSGSATSGINSGSTYTAKADFVGDGTRVVNGVTFNETGAAGTNYSLTGPAANFTGNGNNVGDNATDNAKGLVSDFSYGGTGDAQLVLSGLTPGQAYTTTWYNAAFGNSATTTAAGRHVDIKASDNSQTIRFDENYSGAGNGNLLRYNFVANAPTQTYTFDAVGPDSFHHYAFTNEVGAAAPLATRAAIPAAFTLPAITTATGPGPNYSPFTPLNNDLLQNPATLLGVSSGGFNGDGTGGVPSLTNGIFRINGGNPGDNSQLATATNGAFVQYDLNTTLNVKGYDITSVSGYGGWNDGGRDRQLYNVSYSLVGDAGFIQLGAVTADGPGGGNPSAVMAVFNPANLSGVDAIRFDFLPGQENGYAGYGEFDVVGIATVPEPGRMSLAMLGALSLAARRRRLRQA